MGGSHLPGLSGGKLSSQRKNIAEAEARFYKIFAVMQNPAIIISPHDDTIINVNYRFIQIFGYNLKRLIGHRLSELELWADSQYTELKARTIKDGYLRGAGSNFKNCQGVIIYGQVFVDCIVIKGRKHLLLQIVDVSTEQNLAGVLDKTQRTIVTLLEQINDGYIRLDRSLNFLAVNKKAELILGKTREELIGNNLLRELPLSNDTALGKALAIARSKNDGAVAEEYVSSLGKWLEVNCYPSPEGLVLIIHDITTRKKEEHQLKRSRNDFKTLVENSLDVIVRYDRQLRHIYVNPAIETMTGFKREFFIGRTWDELNRAKEYANIWRKYANQVFASGKGVVFETQIPVVAGYRQCHIQAAPEFDSDGNVEYVLAIIRDITERKKMENEMARLDRLNLVGEMAASIGHEVRNPMTTVRGFLQMLRQKQDLDHYAGFFDLMIEELDRANSIITEYLSLAKNKSIDPKLGNLNSIIKTVLPLIQADALRMGKNVAANFDTVPDLMLDEKEIRQCILNLVRNGLDAMEAGGTVTISTYTEGNKVVLVVRDQGCGISPEILEKLGTPFLTTKENGTGLGLPVCYSITKRHRANISVKTGNNGTTFFIKFNNQATTTK